MDFKPSLAFLSLLFALLNLIIYMRSVFKGQTRPHAFTWGIWALISAITFFAQREAGAGPGAWLQGLNAFSCSVIMALGLIRGDKTYRASDWLALCFALASIPLWLATGTPLWSVVLLCAIDASGFYPTFRKSWRKPTEEPAVPYLLWAAGAAISIASIEAYSFTTVAYPAFLAVINVAFVLMITWRKKRITPASASKHTATTDRSHPE